MSHPLYPSQGDESPCSSHLTPSDVPLSRLPGRAQPAAGSSHVQEVCWAQPRSHTVQLPPSASPHLAAAVNLKT